jgi:hypothetical protein
MKQLITYPIRTLCSKVQKGDIRNTVLRQLHNLENSLNLLDQGRSIKKREIKEYSEKKPSKAQKLKKQVSIITDGINHITKALQELSKYKEISTNN